MPPYPPPVIPPVTLPDREPGVSRVRLRDVVGVGLFGVLISLPPLFGPLNQFDGGLAPSAATFLMHGALPYRDFWWLYGPAGYAVLLPFIAVFGPSLLAIRLAGLLIVFCLTVAGYAWLRTRLPFVLAALIPASTVGFISYLSGLEPTTWNIAMAFGMTGLYVRAFRPNRPVLAGVLIAGAALTRLDLGAYALLAALFVPGRSRFAATVGAIGIVAGVLSVATTSLPSLFDQVIWYPVIGPRQFRGLPLPQVTDFITALAFLVAVTLPKAGVVVAITQMIVGRRPDVALVALTVFAALCQLQTSGRGDLFHQVQGGFPGTILLAYTFGGSEAWWRQRNSRVDPKRWAAFAVLAGVCAFNLTFAAIGLFTTELRSLRPDEQAWIAAVRTIVDRTERDEPIFVGLTSHRFTFANDMLAYYLADRKSGVHVSMFNPGVTNTDRIQQEMIDDLEASGTRYALLDQYWSDASEPSNDSSVPGSTLLDHYLATNFRRACDYGTVHVVVRVTEQAPVSCAPVMQESILDVLPSAGRS